MINKLKTIVSNTKKEIKIYQLVAKDLRTPRLAKMLIVLAIFYALLPFDLIPDFIPIIGHIDDVLIIGVMISLALKMIPNVVLEDCRNRVMIEASK